nr:hypothetical protein [Agrobacterium tumefaciens]
MTDKIPQPVLREGNYPFIDQLYPLAELAMIEVPAALKNLLIIQAEKNGTSIIRDAPTELRGVSEQYGEATFLIYWPHGHDMHMLAPVQFRTGNA